MLCKKCEAENKDNAQFCKRCGAVLGGGGVGFIETTNVEEIKPGGRQNKSSKKNWVIGGSVITVIAVCIIGIVVCFNNQNDVSPIKSDYEAKKAFDKAIQEKVDLAVETSKENGIGDDTITEDDSPEPSDSTITIDELTDGYWENNIQAPYVFKFNEDGTMEAYGLEPYDYYQMKENGGGIEEDKLHFSHEAAYSFKDSKLIITHDDGSRTELEIVTKDAPIKWDTGLSNQLDEIPDGEMFFYETGYDGRDDIPDNAMYLVKREQ